MEDLDQGTTLLDPIDQTITIIDINHNSIHTLQYGLFQKCFRLKSLGLSYNMLTMEDLDAVNTPSGITRLDISGNFILELPYKMFHNLGLLQSLSIQNASVESVDPNAFVNLKNSLQMLDLTENKNSKNSAGNVSTNEGRCLQWPVIGGKSLGV